VVNIINSGQPRKLAGAEHKGVNMERDLIFDRFGGIAVLIDADNAQLAKLKAILDEISKYGRIIVKKAYGDWKNPALKNWEDGLKELAVKPVQQFSYTKGKNATDIALVIDAMDLLSTKNYDAFVIVCSDADYTPLAIRLRETGAYIFGVGEDKTPIVFRNSCDRFVLTKHLVDSRVKTEVRPGKDVAKKGTRRGKGSNDVKDANDTNDTNDFIDTNDATDANDTVDINDAYDISEIHKLLKIASDTYQDDDGWVNAATAGHYLKRARPDFELKTYGVSKLSDLINKYSDIYEAKKYKDGKVTVFAYKLKQ